MSCHSVCSRPASGVRAAICWRPRVRNGWVMDARFKAIGGRMCSSRYRPTAMLVFADEIDVRYSTAGNGAQADHRNAGLSNTSTKSTEWPAESLPVREPVAGAEDLQQRSETRGLDRRLFAHDFGSRLAAFARVGPGRHAANSRRLVPAKVQLDLEAVDRLAHEQLVQV